MSDVTPRSSNIQMTGPFDSVRDYVAALEARGRLVRIEKMDQDKYEATAFAYKLIDKMGYYDAPAFLIENVKIDGQWIRGPVVGNLYGGWDTEAMAYGVEEITDDQNAMFRRTRDRLVALADREGKWPKIEPIIIAAADAPCKEVLLTGNDIDLLKFPFLQSNPGDAGRYINSASVFMQDANLGRNVATYRCQVKGKAKIGVNAEIGQHGYRFLMKARKNNNNAVQVALALGQDPIIFALSASKVTGLGEDELDVVGGLRGKPVELVKCETSDIMVPAHAEMIIEGEIPLEMEEEGPYGEVYGYMGLKKPKNFFMNVKAITHRRDPLFINSFAGVTKLVHSMPTEANDFMKYKRLVPSLVDFHAPAEITGLAIASIDKIRPGEGMVVGQLIAATRMFSKMIIVVDMDVDILNTTQILQAIGTRWQPDPASLLIPQTAGMPLDPSQPKRGLTSKMVIDATRQLPQEGGPDKWPPISRTVLEDSHPDAFELVEENWSKYWSQ